MENPYFVFFVLSVAIFDCFWLFLAVFEVFQRLGGMAFSKACLACSACG